MLRDSFAAVSDIGTSLSKQPVKKKLGLPAKEHVPLSVNSRRNNNSYWGLCIARWTVPTEAGYYGNMDSCQRNTQGFLPHKRQTVSSTGFPIFQLKRSKINTNTALN